jgi:hypothetical protein
VDDGHSQEEYLRQVLEAYRKTPGTMGTVRRADRSKRLVNRMMDAQQAVV